MNQFHLIDVRWFERSFSSHVAREWILMFVDNSAPVDINVKLTKYLSRLSATY